VSLTTEPWWHIAFASLHLIVGQGVAAWVHRRRFGQDPLVLYTSADNPHQRISRGVAAASIGWALSLGATALWPAFTATVLGRPIVAVPPWVGFVVATPALCAMAAAQFSMGRAFRVGQDPSRAPEGLQTGGLHAISRNPIYVASWLALGGMTLWWPNIPLVLGWLTVGVGIHALVLDEERFLAGRFPEDFARYRARVPRYLGLIRG
jgi:protein-S-isoprenylcysteine O-methyltransferase Ste14